MGEQFFVRNVGIFRKSSCQIQVRGGILIAPERCRNGRNHERDLSIGQAKKRSGTAFQNVRVRTLRLPRERVEGGQRGDATGCSGEYAAAEAHGFGKRFRAAVGFGDKKGGTPEFVCQIRRDQRLGDVMQSRE